MAKDRTTCDFHQEVLNNNVQSSRQQSISHDQSSSQKWGRMLKRRNKPGSSKSAALMKMHSMSSTATSKSESVSRSFAILVFDLSVKHYWICWCLNSATFANFQPVRVISVNVQSSSQTHKRKPSSILRSVVNCCKHLLWFVLSYSLLKQHSSKLYQVNCLCHCDIS